MASDVAVERLAVSAYTIPTDDVRPTLELILDVAPTHLRKSHDPETGLAVIDLDT